MEYKINFQIARRSVSSSKMSRPSREDSQMGQNKMQLDKEKALISTPEEANQYEEKSPESRQKSQ